MKNTVSFGARVVAAWQAIIDNLQSRAVDPKPLSGAYLHALAYFGEKALAEHNKGLLRREGCRAVILACIRAGLDTRDDIVRTVPQHHDCSYRYTAYLLDEATGSDPSEHLWTKGEGGRYRLLLPQ